MNQTQQALANVRSACLQLAQAATALEAIAAGHSSGLMCACYDGRSCAYHSGLIHIVDTARRQAATAERELSADIANPQRDH